MSEKWAPITTGINAATGAAGALGGIMQGIGSIRKPFVDGGIVEAGVEPQPAEALNPIEIWAKGLNPVYFNNGNGTELGLSLQELANLPGVMSVDQDIDGFLHVDPSQQVLVNAAVIAELCKNVMDMQQAIMFLMEQSEMSMEREQPQAFADGGAVSERPGLSFQGDLGIMRWGMKPSAQEAYKNQLMSQYDTWYSGNDKSNVPQWYQDQRAAQEKWDYDQEVAKALETPVNTPDAPLQQPTPNTPSNNPDPQKDLPKGDPDLRDPIPGDAPLDSNTYGAENAAAVSKELTGMADGGKVEKKTNRNRARTRLGANAAVQTLKEGGPAAKTLVETHEQHANLPRWFQRGGLDKKHPTPYEQQKGNK